jgi:hypothetical protein
LSAPVDERAVLSESLPENFSEDVPLRAIEKLAIVPQCVNHVEVQPDFDLLFVLLFWVE